MEAASLNSCLIDDNGFAPFFAARPTSVMDPARATGVLTDLDHQNSSSSGARADWLVELIPSWEAHEGYADLASKHQQRLVPKTSKPELNKQREVLLQLKQMFSLNAQQLASVMQVSRAALYKWLDGEARMRDENFMRMQALKALAAEWQEVVGKPMRRTRGLDREAHAALVQAFSEKEQDAFELAASKTRSLMEKLASRQVHRKNLTEIAKERNWEPLPEEIVRANLSHTIPSVSLSEKEG